MVMRITRTWTGSRSTAIASVFAMMATGGCDDAAIGVTEVARFDAAQLELPEALSYRAGHAFVSLAPKGRIERISVADGQRAPYAQLPVQPSNLVLGSAFDAAGDLFVGVGAANPGDAAGVAAAGVYRIPQGAPGAPELFASSTTGLRLGNAMAFDPDGVLYVSDASEGAIYRFTSAAVGAATPWKLDEALRGDPAACPGTTAAYPLGANGIFAERGALWIANTDRGSLIEIAIGPDGRAGAVTTVVADCDLLEGIDGLRPDPRSPAAGFIAANNARNSLVTISRGGEVAVLHAGPELVGPADLVHVPGTSAPAELLVVNSSFAAAFAPPEAGLTPMPGLVRVTLP